MLNVQKIKNLLEGDKLKRRIYAVREGTYKGNFIVYINTTGDDYNFLMLPYNEPLTMSQSEFETGVEKKIVDYIERLPHNVYQICCAQYNESKAKNNINRLKQSTTSSGMDSREHEE
jgi:hypothetical protein